jgi:hypothetical protein
MPNDRAAVATTKMATTAATASSGRAMVEAYCSRYGGRHRHCSAPTLSGDADTASVHPTTSRYAFVPPARNAFSEPTACARRARGRVNTHARIRTHAIPSLPPLHHRRAAR